MTLDLEAPERLLATSVAELQEHVGGELGVSAWCVVTQEQINAFAEITGDHQWIHTDPARAAAGPFGGTIAHGYYTLALAPGLLDEVMSFDGFELVVNYGLNKLRFPAPLFVGDMVRLRVELSGVEEIPCGATLALRLTFESSRAAKPVCVADAVYRVFTSER